jgi:hypothetical protein
VPVHDSPTLKSTMPAAEGPLICGPPARFIDISNPPSHVKPGLNRVTGRLKHVSLPLKRLNNGTSIPILVQENGKSKIDVFALRIFWSPNGRSQLPENTAMEIPTAVKTDVRFQLKLRESFQTGKGQIKVGRDHVAKKKKYIKIENKKVKSGELTARVFKKTG